MICLVHLKKPPTFVAVSGLCCLSLCGLLVSGCSGGEVQAQRLASKRAPQPSAMSPQKRAGANRMLSMPIRPASASETRLAQQTIRNHLHAFGRSDFHWAYSLLTPRHQQNIGSEEALRAMITSTYSDFMHVRKVDWQDFAKDVRSGDMRVRLTFEASGGGINRAMYFLHPQDGRYLIDGILPSSSFLFNRGPGAPPTRQEQLEQRLFSGVLFSPTPHHRVLDFRPASL